MKKALVVFDGAHFPTAPLDFVLEMNSRDPVMIIGLFLPSVDYSELMRYSYYGNTLAPLYLEEYEEDTIAIKNNVARFEHFCKENHIMYKVHQDIRQAVVRELQLETRYADLMVLSSTHFYGNLGKMIQEEYLDNTLHKTECPVVLLPGSYVTPKNIIFAYDGSASSMHAMKQFVYQFPYWTNLDTLIIYADDNKSEIPFYSLIREYAARHFSKPDYFKLNANPGKYFNTWIEGKGASLLVSGAYGRSYFSELFRRNFLKEVVKTHEIPLFIAHL
jgi:nucleotide-binding universal stress UspA family protein